MSAARMKHFGWGREGEGLTVEEEAFVMARAEARFGTTLKQSASAPRLEDSKLEAPRVTAPASLLFCTSEHYDRAAHTYGKSYPELARGLARDYASAPDIVAYPRNEADVRAVLDWAGGADATVIPFGGGSSVCGGVEPKRNGHKGAVTIDLREMGKVKEVDKTSRAALIDGGTFGPALEAQLGRTGSRCVISRRASNIQRSAAGLRRAAAVTLRRSIRTSTISLNRCTPSRREALLKAAACPAPARVQARTA
jgi:alkyldihydroxyacetonephosphate synthase